ERHRQLAVTQREDAARELDGSAACVAVSEVALERGDRDLLGLVAEQPVVSTALDKIVGLRALTVGVDVPELAWRDAGPFHRLCDGSHDAGAAGSVREARPVAASAGAEDLAVDVGSAATCVLVVFDDE